MGLAADLDYHFPAPGPLRRLVQRFAATRAGGWVFSRVLRHLDDVVKRLSRGRTSAPGILAGLPVLELATTGRRSGKVRSSHLIALPCGADLALLGTNFGQPATPAWVLNLEAEPKATVSYRDRSVAVLARPASPGEYAEVLRTADRIYPGYRAYLRRITGRRVRIFVLAAASS